MVTKRISGSLSFCSVPRNVGSLPVSGSDIIHGIAGYCLGALLDSVALHVQTVNMDNG